MHLDVQPISGYVSANESIYVAGHNVSFLGCLVIESRFSSQFQRPGLAHQIVPEAVVWRFLDQLEARGFVDSAGRNQHVVGP